jgi:hypothetical protein
MSTKASPNPGDLPPIQWEPLIPIPEVIEYDGAFALFVWDEAVKAQNG